MIRASEIIDAIHTYDPSVDGELIHKAYLFGHKAHSGQIRASGEPYFSHPAHVAFSLTKYHMDTSTIITALLHDTVEDTNVTLDDIEREFGADVRQLVDGVTKLSRLEGKTESLKQAENFRKLLVAMSEDLRVLLVKLSDRLHNMQTLKYIKNPEKRERIAKETVEIYAALAERIGMRALKDELQDLAFSELYPDARESIIKRLQYLRETGKTEIDKTVHVIQQKLTDANLNEAGIYGREKKPFSIWKKMEQKNISFEQLSDVIAFRIIVNSVAECYQALGTIHANWHTIPGHFKDYISTPKSNGYQSLHTAIIGPGKQRVEIQIRTQRMHEIAEYGLAAHWTYKQGEKAQEHMKKFRWLRELLEILETSSTTEEFFENTKLEMYHDQVFCFTPKGDILALPRGATPVDFAYAVHSAVGDRCVGAKINSRIVPLRTQLKNGDQVEIITSKTQTPSPSWERFVVTGKARSEIRKFVRTQQRVEYVNLGRAILTKTFKQEGIELQDKMLEPVLEKFNKKTVDDMFAEVGEGMLGRNQVFDAVQGKNKKEDKSVWSSLTGGLRKKQKSSGKTTPMPIKGLIPGMAIHFAKCCHPIPGDRIVGIVTTGKGITIHTMDCETLENYTDAPERWIDVAWEHNAPEETGHISRLRAFISHEPAALATVTNVIAKEMGNINNFKITHRSSDFFEVLVDIEVRDTRHLNNIIAGLRSKEVVQSVERWQV